MAGAVSTFKERGAGARGVSCPHPLFALNQIEV